MRRSRIAVPFILLVILAILISTFLGSKYRSKSYGEQRGNTSADIPLRSSALIDFMRGFEKALLLAKPGSNPIRLPRTVTLEEQQASAETAVRPDIVHLDEVDIEDLMLSHAAMVDSLKRLSPQLHYERGSKGIVIPAGGNYLPIAILSIRMLRRSNTTLPVQVFLDKWAEYDARSCEHILPSLNARCLVLADVLAAAPLLDALTKYQLKAFAILLSSFENVIFFDADAFPTRNPEFLLDTEPFRSSGLVTWPDFWLPTSSRYFYKIARLEVPPLALRRCSESGIMLYSKRRHADTLLLSAYYNYYGPNYYYPLLSQGASGQGDKETFLHAALALQKPFYDVRTPVAVLGNWFNKTWHTVGLKQANPAEDWANKPRAQNTQAVKSSVQASDMTKVKVKGHRTPIPPENLARPFFIHHNILKLDARYLLDRLKSWRNETGQVVRLWGDRNAVIASFGYDVERVLWEELVIVACDVDDATCEKMRALFQRVTPESG
jgi:alpha 1,2-mannosyltransferase